MLESQSQGNLIANPSLAKKLTTIQKQASKDATHSSSAVAAAVSK